MALAKKCDRSGKLHEHYSTFNSCMIIVSDKYGQVGITSKRYDLCPDCIQELTDFMEAPQRATDNSDECSTRRIVNYVSKDI